MKSEDEAGHELKIHNMIQEDDYKSPWEEKDATDATTVNNTLDNTGYTYLNSYQPVYSNHLYQSGMNLNTYIPCHLKCC